MINQNANVLTRLKEKHFDICTGRAVAPALPPQWTRRPLLPVHIKMVALLIRCNTRKGPM